MFANQIRIESPEFGEPRIRSKTGFRDSRSINVSLQSKTRIFPLLISMLLHFEGLNQTALNAKTMQSRYAPGWTYNDNLYDGNRVKEPGSASPALAASISALILSS